MYTRTCIYRHMYTHAYIYKHVYTHVYIINLSIQEFLRDPEDPGVLLDETRDLGLVVCRGTAVVLVCPTQGMEEIANPFTIDDDDEDEDEDEE